jgi:DNA invertase Pin-like site-specific DNA recombinase
MPPAPHNKARKKDASAFSNGENTMNYSYQRVSTAKQDERRQDISLEGFKIDRKYIDKVSGKNVDRPQLNKLQLEAKSGDTIYVESISRLGRNVDDLRALCEYFREREVTVHFVKEGFSTSGNMYKFLLTILGAVAEMERELIVERVYEGLHKARTHGTRSGKAIGRPGGLTFPKTWEKYYDQWKKHEITAVQFARLVGLSRSSLYRYIDAWNTHRAPTL